MRFDPRLLAGVDDERRARVLSRLAEVMALTDAHQRHPARVMTRAKSWRRWPSSTAAGPTRCPFSMDWAATRRWNPARRCLFLVTAGDVLLHKQGDAAGAALRYQRARALNPSEPRLARIL